ncbi:peptidoglycan-recognition protein SA [Lucilia sericata]|uniref:peptidoglycan-recognition protein SA n=1 Tax=Lucilia sericata TaxID=13632 RepID=UPI0018A83F55|nr:peptidoglycan-recognition protein SA [Lucilia sericata]
MSKIILTFLTITSIIYIGLAKKNNDDCPRIKLKRQWGGQLSKIIDYRPIPIKYVIIHHTVTPECRTFLKCSDILQNMQYYHINDLEYNDIGYNFLIGNDGVVYEGTGWRVAGAHTYGYNTNGTGIAFIGNYSAKLPTEMALNAAKKLLECGVKNGELDPNYELFAASQVSSTKSPGLILYNEIQDWDHWSPHAE